MRHKLFIFGLEIVCIAWLSAPCLAADSIVGRWRGMGVWEQMEWEFREDGTFSAGNDRGVWEPHGEDYLVYEKQKVVGGGRVARIDEAGRLHVIDLVLQREEALEARRNMPPPTAKELTGEWLYVYSRNWIYDLAPPLDIMRFTADGDVVSTLTLDGSSHRDRYTMNEDLLRMTGTPPDVSERWLRVRYDREKDELIARPPHPNPNKPVEWVFVRAGRMLPYAEVAGVWTIPGEMGDFVREYTYHPDGRGSYRLLDAEGLEIDVSGQNPNNYGSYFRVWRSPLGTMLTAVTPVPYLGPTAQVMRYTIEADRLEGTGVDQGADGELTLTEDQFVLTRKRAE